MTSSTLLKTFRTPVLEPVRPVASVPVQQPAASSLNELLCLNSFVTVTPELANRILAEANYDGQRPARPVFVALHAEVMRRGEWVQGKQIHFARMPTGRLILVDGQHRLLAVVQSGIPVMFQILITDVSSHEELRTLYRRQDRNAAARTTADSLSAAGVIDDWGLQREIASGTFEAVNMIEAKFQRGQKNAYNSRSDEHRLRICAPWWPYAQEFQAAIEKSARGLKGRLKGGAVMAVALVTLRYQGVKAREFWRNVASGTYIDAGDPAGVYFKYLLSTQGSTRGAGNLDAARGAATAWNAFYQDRDIHMIRGHSRPVLILGTPFAKSE